MNLQSWKEVYEKNKFDAYCIDIEGSGGRDSFITIIGLFRPKNGPVDGYISLVRGKNLTAKNLKSVLKNAKMLITFSGTDNDLPSIAREFPGCIPNVPHLDLYLLAKDLNLGFGLKTLEQNFGIYRREEVENKRRVAVKWWRKYEKTRDPRVLDMLIAYNREDTINLYMLAEALMKKIKA